MGKEKIIDIKLSKIIKDKRQLSVRIPAKIVLDLEINEKRDGLLWTIEEKDGGIFLKGALVKEVF